MEVAPQKMSRKESVQDVHQRIAGSTPTDSGARERGEENGRGRSMAVPPYAAMLRTGDATQMSGRKKENVYKGHLDLVLKENKKMKGRLEALDKENQDLKRAVYELSEMLGRRGPGVTAFDVDKMLTRPLSTEPGDVLSSVNHSESGYIDDSRPVSDSLKNENGSRFFNYKYALKKHEGAVYDLAYSPNGAMLASASFDKTVKIWHMEESSMKQQAQSLAEHTSVVSGVSWCADSTGIASGGFDHSLKYWDIAPGSTSSTHTTEGYILTVAVDPSDANMLYAGTSSGCTCVFDRRQQAIVTQLEATPGCHVNSIYVFKTGGGILAGDSGGLVTTWDVRGRREIHQFRPSNLAVSHVHCSQPSQGDLEGRFISVNSYDEVLRVYRRAMPNHRDVTSHVPQCDLVHSVQGHANQGYPIKSAFFEGPEYQIGSTWSMQRRVGSRDDDEMLDDINGMESQMKDEKIGLSADISESLLLATGSAEPGGGIYVYDIGGPTGTAQLIQKLEGHTDRVCGVSFHPKHPILASCSADKTVRIWTPTSNFSTVTRSDAGVKP